MLLQAVAVGDVSWAGDSGFLNSLQDVQFNTLAPEVQISNVELQKFYLSLSAVALVEGLKKEWPNYGPYELYEFLNLYRSEGRFGLCGLARYAIEGFFIDKQINNPRHKVEIVNRAYEILRKALPHQKYIPENIKAIIFALDGTLYQSKELSEVFDKVRIAFISAKLEKTKEEAEKLYNKTKEDLSKDKLVPPTDTEILRELGLTVDDWEEYNADKIHPERYLKRDGDLKRVLQKLKADGYTLVIFTNNSDSQTERILKALGIEQCFDRNQIFTRTALKTSKPSLESFRAVCERLGLRPEQCFSLGHRDEVDISPARLMGMKAMLIESLDDIYNLSTEQDSANPKKSTVKREDPPQLNLPEKLKQEVLENRHNDLIKASLGSWWETVGWKDEKWAKDITSDLRDLLIGFIPNEQIRKNEALWGNLIYDSLKKDEKALDGLRLSIEELKAEVRQDLKDYYPRSANYSFKADYYDLVVRYIMTKISFCLNSKPQNRLLDEMEKIANEAVGLSSQFEEMGIKFEEGLFIRDAIFSLQLALKVLVGYKIGFVEDIVWIEGEIKKMEHRLERLERTKQEKYLTKKYFRLLNLFRQKILEGKKELAISIDTTPLIEQAI